MEITIDGVKFKNVPDKRYGTKINDILTQSNIGMSADIAAYIQSEDFYTLVNGLDIDWDGIEIDNNTTINTTSDLIKWLKSLSNAAASKDEDKPYDPDAHSGLGRKTLELKEDGSNVLTQDDFDQENTIYVITYDFDLNGHGITIPNNSVLEFDGGSIVGSAESPYHNDARLKTNGKVRVKGYGLMCRFDWEGDMNNVTFEDPYCVDPAYTGEKMDGSPERPFNCLQLALDFSNNVVIKRGSILNYKSVRRYEELANDVVDCFGVIRGDTVIGAYGTGKNPLLTGKVNISNCVQYKEGGLNICDISNSSISDYYTREHICDVSEVRFAWALQGQIYRNTDYYNYALVDSAAAGEALVGREYWYYPGLDASVDLNRGGIIEDSVFKKIVMSNPLQVGVDLMNLGLCGINCLGRKLVISDIDFSEIACHAVYGINGNRERGANKDAAISNCNFTSIGGSILEIANGTITRYGNAIEAYSINSQAKGIEVTNCSFCDVFDAAITIQGRDLNTNNHYGLNVYNCSFTRCAYGIEVFDTDINHSFNISLNICNNTFVSCYSPKLRIVPTDKCRDIRTRCGALLLSSTARNSNISGNVVYDSPILGTVYQNILEPAKPLMGRFMSNRVILTDKDIPVITSADSQYDMTLRNRTKNYIENFLNTIGTSSGGDNVVVSVNNIYDSKIAVDADACIYSGCYFLTEKSHGIPTPGFDFHLFVYRRDDIILQEAVSTRTDVGSFYRASINGGSVWKNWTPVSENNTFCAAFVGDSITSYINSSPQYYESHYPNASLAPDVTSINQMWFSIVADYLGVKIANCSKTSSLVTGDPLNNSVNCGCSDKRVADVGRNGSVKYLFVFMGTNGNENIGTWEAGDPIENTAEFASNFKPAYALMISKLKSRYPNATIICLTLFNNSAKTAAIEEVAEDMNVACIDVSESVVATDSATYTYDGIHPNKDGQQKLAEFVINELIEQNLIYVG